MKNRLMQLSDLIYKSKKKKEINPCISKDTASIKNLGKG